jgi:hypothetical protein
MPELALAHVGLVWDKTLLQPTKKHGRISLCLVNRCRGAIDLFPEDPTSALELIRSRLHYAYNHGEKYRVISEEEARKLFEAEGVRILDMLFVAGWMCSISQKKF